MSATVPGGTVKLVPMQTAAGATGNGVAIKATDAGAGGYAILSLQVTGTFVGTVTFECTINGTTWVALEMSSIGASGTLATTATAPGIWTADVMGLVQVRARVSAWTSGAITVVGCLVA